MASSLVTKTPPGLHDFLAQKVLPRYVTPGGRAVDLGAGSGALAVRLRSMGLDVLAVDINAAGFKVVQPDG